MLLDNWSGGTGTNCNWYPVYYPYYCTDKTAQAFKIVQKLIDKKLINPKTIKEFIELVSTITNIL